jgi:hypothetical protein
VNKLSFYEQVGIVIPGAVFLFVTMFYVPELRNVLGKDGVNLGGLGVFVLIAYAMGHLLGAVGNLIEAAYWRTRGGMPTSWVVGSRPRLLSPEQIVRLEVVVNKRLGLDVKTLRNFDGSAWLPISRQIDADVQTHVKASRIETFNGNYGLNRGLCAAMLVLAFGSLLVQPARWFVSLGLAAMSAIYLYRMHRFGVHYAGELYNQFLLLPLDATASKKVAERRGPEVADHHRSAAADH